MWRRALSAAAWAAVIIVLGSSSGRVPAAESGSRPAFGNQEVEKVAARLDALTVAITGGVEELRASERLNYHRVEGGIAACMAAAGRPYRKRPFVSRYDEFTDADLGYGTGRASIIDSVTEMGRRLVLNEIAYTRMERAGLANPAGAGVAPDGVDTLNRCTAQFQHRAYGDIDPPPGAYELANSLDMELGEAVGGDRRTQTAWESYRPCMRARVGEDVQDRSDFLFRPRLPRGEAPIDGRPQSAAWARGLAALEAAFAADTQCRFPAYLAAMRVVAAHLDGWERRHRAELDAIREAWRQRVADVAHLPR
ncbi:hypothetical protein Vau01_098540 [Virgisporangium aurantiacum]|uniref:Uncharacterized protein n=2 Tax=Virgisporangium aurantiacum TaxID=175570 RepID=A0A8J4E5Q5_9ACTN|nr:hypothetical protein Vau01_098540 [Virgisporangium aurantiacum]